MQILKLNLDKNQLLLIPSSLFLSLLTPILFVYNKNIFIVFLALLYSVFILIAVKDNIIYIIIALSFTIDYVVYLAGLPSYFTYFLHLNIFVYVVFVLSQMKLRKWPIRNNPFLVIWMIYMIVIGLVNSPFSILTFQRSISYFLFPLLFLATIYRDEPQAYDYRKISFLLFCVSAQIPVTMVQKVIYWNWSGDTVGQMAVDRVGGTLGWAGTNFMAVLMGMAFCCCLTNWLHKKTINSFIIMLTPFIPLALGNATAGFAFALIGGIVVIGIFNSDSNQPITRKVIGLIGVLIPVLLAFVLLANLLPKLDPNFDTSSWKLFTSPAHFIKYTTGYQDSNEVIISGPARRLEQINFVNKITTNKWFGSGIGILSYSNLLGIGPANTYLIQTLLWSTGFTRHFLETGIIGTVLYILLLFSFIPISVKLLKKSIPYGKNRIFLTSFPALVVIFILSCLYSDVWKFYGTACVFWLTAGIVWKQNQSYSNRVLYSR